MYSIYVYRFRCERRLPPKQSDVSGNTLGNSGVAPKLHSLKDLQGRQGMGDMRKFRALKDFLQACSLHRT